MIFDTIAKDIVAVIFAISAIIFFYFKWSFKYWARKCMPFLEPKFPFGNMENPFDRKTSLGLLMKAYYEEFKARGCKHGGIYNFSFPMYMPVNPEYVKNIMQKDFQYFVDRGAYYNERDDPLSAHLFNIGGKQWRNLRVKLTPSFTSGKMKMMFDTLVQCSDQMIAAVDEICEKDEAIDIKDVVARFTTDIIGSCAFGLECNSFKDPDAEFRKHGKNMFASHSKLKSIGHIFGIVKPEIANFLGIVSLPRESTKFFYKVIDETLRFREKNKVRRNDLLQLLIDMKEDKENKNKENTLTTEEIAAQALAFFLGGFETSSTTMSYCLFELAMDHIIQNKVRNEINQVLEKYHGKIRYESITEMEYLGQVVDETLRKYPALPSLTRRCVMDYKVPGTEITIEKGTMVFIPVLGLQRDPDYFPDPEKFDPERFTEENKKQIRPFTYLPFGEGPRLCIGICFGLMQTKVGLISLLKDYKFSLNDRTKVPLEINPYNDIILTSKGDMLFNAEKLFQNSYKE